MQSRILVGVLSSVLVGVAWVAVAAAEPADDGESSRRDQGWYAGLGVGAFRVRMSRPGYAQSADVLGGYGRLGYDLNENVGLELRLGTTGSESDRFGAGTLGAATAFTVDLDADYFLSYLVKLETAAVNEIRFYGLLGGTTGRTRARVSGASVTIGDASSHSSFSYGAGIVGSITDQLTLAAEYARYLNDVGVGGGAKGTIEGIVGTLTYRF